MAGTDTFRGCAFQGAYSVRLAFDVIEGASEILQLEGDSDIVDAALEGKAGKTLRSVQAKTKVEPYVWYPGEVVEVIESWLGSAPEDCEALDFVTDGQLGPGVAKELVPALRRHREGILSSSDRTYLTKVGLDPDQQMLARVSIHSRVPGGRTILDEETLRLIELRERGHPLGVDEARDLVKALFGELMLGSGEGEREERRLSRASLAEQVGIDLESLDRSSPWSLEIEDQYRRLVVEEEDDPAWTMLDLLEAERPAALTLVSPREGPDQRFPADDLLSRAGSALVAGPAGAGKSTMLAQLASIAADSKLLPIRIDLASYSAGSLRRAIQVALETKVGGGLAPGTAERLLARSSSLVLIDGAGELVAEQRRSLLGDISEIAKEHPTGARFLLAARHPLPFAELALEEFIVQGLDKERRCEIAAALCAGEDPVAFTEQLETELGSLIENPLLFTMAVALRRRGVGARTRTGLFRGFIEGLQARPEGTVLTTEVLLALERCALGLRESGRYSAEEWWWLERIAAERKMQIDRGILQPDAPAASELLGTMLEIGLVRRLGFRSELGFLHDLFADWLAAEAVRKGVGALDESVGPELEEAIAFLAEDNALNEEQIFILAGSPIAAARAADALSAESSPDAVVVHQLWERLAASLGPALRERLLPLTLEISGEGRVAMLVDPNRGGEKEGPPPVLTSLARQPATSLSLAVDLWLAAVRLALNTPRRLRPRYAAQDQQALAAQLTAASTARVESTRSLIADIVPGLEDRLLSEIGPIAIHGWLLPAEESPNFFPGDDSIVEHHLFYVRVENDPLVVAIKDKEQLSQEPSHFGRTVGELYLQEPIADAARNAVKVALEGLIARAK